MNNNGRTPNRHPIENLYIFTEHIDGMLEADLEQYEGLIEALSKPHVLTDQIVSRVVKVYTQQKDDLDLFDQQLQLWQKDVHKFTLKQNQEVARLVGQMARTREVVNQILALAKELGKGTIERVLAKSDIELGLEVLLRDQSDTRRGSNSGPNKPKSKPNSNPDSH